jgi:predicted AAA+ superfamily ATPase
MSTFAGSLGIDNKTVRRYLDMLQGVFMIRLLEPFSGNLKKRLVKSPKIYLRDTGILNALLGLPDWNAMAGHPVYDGSWESLCVENIIARIQAGIRFSFYRTSNGAEIDLVLEKGNERMAVEFKASSAPRVERGFRNAMDDLGISRA